MRLLSFFNHSSRRQSRPRPQCSSVLQLEQLEDRCLPSATLGDPAQGYTLTILNGAGQVAPIGIGGFDNRFQVLVQNNGQPVPHALVDFTAPTSGPSGDFGPQFVMFPTPHVVYPTDIGVTADENGVATAPTFEVNGLTGPYNVSADIPGTGISVNFNLANAVFPGPLPPAVNQQLLVNLLALPSFTNPQAESELQTQFGNLFALAYMQSPQQASLLFWQEFALTKDLVLAGGDFRQFQSNFDEWKSSWETSINPVYITQVGYVMSLLETELLLVQVVS